MEIHKRLNPSNKKSWYLGYTVVQMLYLINATIVAVGRSSVTEKRMLY